MLAVAMCAMACVSCTSDDEDVIGGHKLPKKALTKLADGTEQLVTDMGEVIHITDTTVYDVLSENFQNEGGDTCDLWCSDFLTRADNNNPVRMTVKGFDSQTTLIGYKKYSFGREDAQKYGIHPGIYLVSHIIIAKDLAQSDDESIKARDYTTNFDDTPMGWHVSDYNLKNKYIKGFDVSTNPVNGFVTATTLLQYIKCDTSGASYNKYIPYEPSTLIWQYVLSYSPSWD